MERLKPPTKHSFSGTIFAANDASGIPSIEVLDTGLVKFAQYNGAVAISTSTAQAAQGLTVNTNTYITSLGVGTVASGTAGEIRATYEITAYYSSDETLKTNVRVIDNALGRLRQISGVFFDWTDEAIANRGGEDGYFVRKEDTGVIAQKVEPVLPQVVARRDDGTLAVKYEKMAGLIIQAINELADQVDEIKKKLE